MGMWNLSESIPILSTLKKKKNPVNSAKLIIWHRVHTAVLNSNFEQLNIDGIVPEVSFYNGIYL